LKDFLPKKPSEVELKVMKEMFEASVDGQAYDAERWGNYYKPRGVAVTTTDSAPATATAPAVADEEFDAPAAPVATPAPVVAEAAPTAPVATPPAGGTARAEDILAMIRNRQKAV
jgi:hypothetical protein